MISVNITVTNTAIVSKTTTVISADLSEMTTATSEGKKKNYAINDWPL